MASKVKDRRSYCSVSTCLKNSNTHPDISYFRLPNDAKRAAVWLKNIKLENTTLKKVLVCETHFEERYVNTNESRKRLSSIALPTLNLPGDITCDYTPSIQLPDINNVAIQTDESLDTEDSVTVDEIDLKPDIEVFDDFAIIHLKEKMKFEQETQSKKRKLESPEIIQPMILEHGSTSEDSSDVIISKLIKLFSAVKKKKKGEVYTNSFKFYALKLYFRCPKTYKALQKTLTFPSISMLYRLCIPQTTEGETAVSALEVRVNDMTERQKQCAICIGAITLKEKLYYDKSNDRVIGFHEVDGIQRLEPAKFLFVVMVRGLFDDWKHVISYSFLAQFQNYKDKTIYLDNIIAKMFRIGLKVRVLISDTESEFMSAAIEKNIIPNRPYFFVNEKKIYYMYDPPHIIRVVRDNLMDKDFHIGDTVVKWKYISEFYKLDLCRPFQLAPKLTDNHIKPNAYEKIRVSLAAQIFSKSTAAGMSALIDLKLIDESAKHTVEWIARFNKLFDLLNFSKFGDSKTVFRGDNLQINYLRETMALISEIRVIDSENGGDYTKKSKFIRYYQTTINAVLALYEHFKVEDRKSLQPWFTRDCLDIFFEKVRDKYNVPATCESARNIIKKLPIFNIFQWIARGKSDNLDTFLDLAEEFTSIVYKQPKIQDASKSLYDIKTTVDFTSLKLPKKYTLKYISSYLLYESFQLHSECVELRNYIFNNQVFNTSEYECFYFKNPKDDVGIVPVPPDFERFIQLLDITITLHFDFKNHTVSNHIISSLINAVKDVGFVVPCDCFPLSFIKELYVRFRFYLLLNYNNRVYKSGRKNRNFFSINANFEVLK